MILGLVFFKREMRSHKNLSPVNKESEYKLKPLYA